MTTTIIPILLGMVSLLWLPSLPSLQNILLLAVSIIILYAFFRHKLLRFILCATLGFVWGLYHIHAYHQMVLPQDLDGQVIVLTGQVISQPIQQGKNKKFSFKTKKYDTKQHVQYEGVLQVTWPAGPQQLQLGDTWELPLKLSQPRGYANPGSFDVEKLFFIRNWHGLGRVMPQPGAKKLLSAPNAFPGLRFREQCRQKLLQILKEEPLQNMLIALGLGEQTGISQAARAVLQKTGTSHLMAISGLHIGLVAALFTTMVITLLKCLPVMSVRYPPRFWGIVVGMLVAFGYALLAGFQVATQRAVVMIVVFCLALLSKRVVRAWDVYWLAMGVVLLWSPMNILLPGFWLSFGAVAIIFLFLKPNLNNTSRWQKWIIPHWVMFLGLLPLSLIYFGQVSWISPIANFIAIPMMGLLIVPSLVVGLFLLILGIPVGKYGILLATKILNCLWFILQYLSEISWASQVNVANNIVVILFMIIGIIWLLMPKGFPGRIWGIACFLPWWLYQPSTLPHGVAKLTVLDVGQGLASVIQTQHHILVYDTGPKLGYRLDMGKEVVAPYLAHQHIQHIDKLVISHSDNDHVGGAEYLLTHYGPDAFIGSDQSAKIPYTARCQQGMSWEWDGVNFEFLYPFTINDKKNNNNSCVLRVTAKDQRVLLTGDIGRGAEKKLLQYYGKQLRSEVLVVPHHGSHSSSSEAFVNAVSPRYAIIPVGHLNRYRHPHRVVLSRYRNIRAKLFNTAKHGAIEVKIGEEVKIKPPSCYRIDHLRFWFLDMRKKFVD